MRLTKYQTKQQHFFDRDIPMSRYISISHLNSPSIFETKAGAQGAVIQLGGFFYTLADPSELHSCQRIFSNLLLSLSEAFGIYVTVVRRKTSHSQTGQFSAGFAQEFMTAYQSALNEKSFFSNYIYLTVLIQGPGNNILKHQTLRNKLSHQVNKDVLHAFRLKQKEKLEKTVQDILVQLADFRPRLLGDRAGQYSEVLEFFSMIINGQAQACRYPLQDAAHYLPTKRLCFGHNMIQWLGNHQDDHQFGALVSIKNYCPETHSLMLAPLMSLAVESIQTHSFLKIPSSTALQLINKQANHFTAVNDAAHSQHDALFDAKDHLASGRLAFGYHHHTVMVLASSKQELEENIAQVTKCYRAADLIAIRESLNLESAFWAQLPGNATHITRKALITSDNFADFCPLYNESTGYQHQNHLGGSVLLLETPNHTPLYFNFHERSQGKHDMSKGHTTIIAPSNAGKTTLMNALDCGMKQYGGTSIFFDRDRGCEIYVRAVGGCYQRLHPDEMSGFNPLQLEDNEANRHFLVRWLQALVESDGRTVTAEQLLVIEKVIHRNFTLPLAKRRLRFLATFFSHDFPLSTLQPWLGGEQAGRLAYLFDNETDQLSLYHGMLGFDLTHLLDHESQAVLLPVLLYLFHRIEQLFTGRLLGIYLDEGWQYLDNPYWKAKLRAYLPSLRKKNVYMVFATQSPGTVARSSLRDELISGSATNIFLPNPKADVNDYCDAFKLTPQEYNFIKTTPLAARQFLIKQGNETTIGRLDLSGLTHYASVLAGNQQTINLLDNLRASVGDDPSRWLPLFYKAALCS